MNGVRLACSLITVRDMARSRDFYERILSQKVKYDFGENVTYEGDFALHEEKHFRSLLGEGAAPSGTGTGHDFELYFETDDIEAIVRKLEDERTEFIHRIKEQPWGQQVMRLYDPDRHIVEIGEPMSAVIRRLHAEGMTAQEIEARTSLPAAIILKTIKER